MFILMVPPEQLKRAFVVALGLALLAVALVVTACNQGPSPAPVPDGSCAEAGLRLRVLGCRTEDGRPLWETPEGTSFALACERAAEDGRNWHPHCIRYIERCEELEAAYRGQDCKP